MSKWNSPAEWQRLCDGSACPICARGQPLNITAHLHMHFFPRYAGDPFEGRAIEPARVTKPVYAAGQFSDLRNRLLQELGASAA